MITDGCTQEYLSFINNCGQEEAFPSAVHALCYFHLVLIGWSKHCKGCFPNDGKLARKYFFPLRKMYSDTKDLFRYDIYIWKRQKHYDTAETLRYD